MSPPGYDCCASLDWNEPQTCADGYLAIRRDAFCTYTCVPAGCYPAPPPPIPPEPWGKLSPSTCRNLLADPDFLFRRMWGIHERTQNQHGRHACWDVGRADRDLYADPSVYFEEIERGVHCGDNWCGTGLTPHWDSAHTVIRIELPGRYDGNNGMYGNSGWFGGDLNPALLGFDDDIKRYCRRKGGSCDNAGFAILNMFGRIPYNMCRNCAPAAPL